MSIETFADRKTENLFNGESGHKFATDIVRRAKARLDQINLAADLRDLKVPPGNRLEALSGDREGQYSIRINDKWRICFRWEDGDAFDVEVNNHYRV
ncbi:MAG: type II toxin-antitoxin system RelE/ParE family toxin [Alphaproteobacteria bacterium]